LSPGQRVATGLRLAEQEQEQDEDEEDEEETAADRRGMQSAWLV
jgi:hypothetical protein